MPDQQFVLTETGAGCHDSVGYGGPLGGEVFLLTAPSIEPGVQVLEKPLRDVTEGVELVECAEQEGLVHHGSERHIRDFMPGDVDHRHTGHFPTAFKVVGNRWLVSLNGTSDASSQIVTLLEIDVCDVVAAAAAVQRNRRAIDVYSCQLGDITRLRDNLLDDLQEVPQFIGGSEGVVCVRRGCRQSSEVLYRLRNLLD